MNGPFSENAPTSIRSLAGAPSRKASVAPMGDPFTLGVNVLALVVPEDY
jgi:hypothetical protein